MIILGSKSPRRKEILEMANINFSIATKEVEENIVCDDPVDFTIQTSLKKAKAIYGDYPNDTLICADTIVFINGLKLGKPKNEDEAFQMIKMIEGKTHEVVTGVFLGNIQNHESFAVKTKVKVSHLTNEEIREYVKSTEPFDKAGGYAIQGLFGKYIESIEGDYYNVMGLPINTIYKKLKKYENIK